MLKWFMVIVANAGLMCQIKLLYAKLNLFAYLFKLALYRVINFSPVGEIILRCQNFCFHCKVESEKIYNIVEFDYQI